MDLRYEGAMMIFGSVISFFVFIYLLRFFFVSKREGFVTAATPTAPAAPTAPATAPAAPAATEPIQYPGSSFSIQCPNSAAPIITFQDSMNSFGAAGSGTAEGLSGSPGSTPPSGVSSSTPAATKKDDTPTNVAEDEDDTEYKPSLEKCKQYYSFDPNVDR